MEFIHMIHRCIVICNYYITMCILYLVIVNIFSIMLVLLKHDMYKNVS